MKSSGNNKNKIFREFSYSELAVKALKHGSVINELQNVKENFLRMQGTRFPDNVTDMQM